MVFWTRQGIQLFVAASILFGTASIWFDDPTTLTTALGLITVGLSFALQKVVTAIAGYFVEVLQRGRLQAALAAVIGGRVVFLAVMVFTGAISTSLPAYLQAAMLPGLLAALAQVVLLPLLAHVWVTRAHR